MAIVRYDRFPSFCHKTDSVLQELFVFLNPTIHQAKFYLFRKTGGVFFKVRAVSIEICSNSKELNPVNKAVEVGVPFNNFRIVFIHFATWTRALSSSKMTSPCLWGYSCSFSFNSRVVIVSLNSADRNTQLPYCLTKYTKHSSHLYCALVVMLKIGLSLFMIFFVLSCRNRTTFHHVITRYKKSFLFYLKSKISQVVFRRSMSASSIHMEFILLPFGSFPKHVDVWKW